MHGPNGLIQNHSRPQPSQCRCRGQSGELCHDNWTAERKFARKYQKRDHQVTRHKYDVMRPPGSLKDKVEQKDEEEQDRDRRRGAGRRRLAGRATRRPVPLREREKEGFFSVTSGSRSGVSISSSRAEEFPLTRRPRSIARTREYTCNEHLALHAHFHKEERRREKESNSQHIFAIQITHTQVPHNPTRSSSNQSNQINQNCEAGPQDSKLLGCRLFVCYPACFFSKPTSSPISRIWSRSPNPSQSTSQLPNKP
jgi:hypothetical protein